MKMSKLGFFLLLLFFLLGVLIQAYGATTSVTLAWHENSEDDLGGYYLYYKINGAGPPYNGTSLDEGDSPIKISLDNLNLVFAANETNEFTIHGLNENDDYTFALTAYDTEVPENESDYSNEASRFTPNNDYDSDGFANGVEMDQNSDPADEKSLPVFERKIMFNASPFANCPQELVVNDNTPDGASVETPWQSYNGVWLQPLRGSGWDNRYGLINQEGDDYLFYDGNIELYYTAHEVDAPLNNKKTIYFKIETATGDTKYMQYDFTESPGSSNDTYLKFAKGLWYANGETHVISFQLREDFATLLPDDSLSFTKAFWIRGDSDIGKVSAANMILNKIFDVGLDPYNNWVVNSGDPDTASVEFVHDTASAEDLVQLSTPPEDPTWAHNFRLEDSSGSLFWHNTEVESLVFGLQARDINNAISNGLIIIYLEVIDTLGVKYYLQYYLSDTCSTSSGSYVKIALGSELADGSLHYVSRNIHADFKTVFPNKEIAELNGIIIRGTVRMGLIAYP